MGLSVKAGHRKGIMIIYCKVGIIKVSIKGGGQACHFGNLDIEI